MFEKTGYVSYANCCLPYDAGGVIEKESTLALQRPESFQKRFDIDVRVRHEIGKINRKKKTVSVRNLETETEFEETYDKLILSPGARPILPETVGDVWKRAFTLRNVEDTLRIRSFVTEQKPQNAVIVAGFIRLEMAEKLMKMGVDITIIQRGKRLLHALDEDMTSFTESKLLYQWVGFMRGVRVTWVAERQLGSGVVWRESPDFTAI